MVTPVSFVSPASFLTSWQLVDLLAAVVLPLVIPSSPVLGIPAIIVDGWNDNTNRRSSTRIACNNLFTRITCPGVVLAPHHRDTFRFRSFKSFFHPHSSWMKHDARGIFWLFSRVSPLGSHVSLVPMMRTVQWFMVHVYSRGYCHHAWAILVIFFFISNSHPINDPVEMSGLVEQRCLLEFLSWKPDSPIAPSVMNIQVNPTWCLSRHVLPCPPQTLYSRLLNIPCSISTSSCSENFPI